MPRSDAGRSDGFVLKHSFRKMYSNLNKQAAPGSYDAEIGSAVDQVERLWHQWVDSEQGFRDIDDTGKSRAGLTVLRRSRTEFEVREDNENLENIREGTAPTGKFDAKVYEWALRKVLKTPQALGAARNDPRFRTVRRDARALTMGVAKHGTSMHYKRFRFPVGHPGFDYPRAFLEDNTAMITEFLREGMAKVAAKISAAYLEGI